MTHRLNIWLSLLVVSMLFSCKTVNHLAEEKAQTYRIADKLKVDEDVEIQVLIAPYKAQFDTIMQVEIGTFNADYNKAMPESTLGNWFADIFLLCAQANYDFPIDFAVQNYGGIRRPNVSKGPITVGLIYELMPFDNQIVIFKGDYKLVQQLFDHIAAYGGWPISKGISFKIKDSKAVDITMHGKPLDENAEYTFAIPDYIANGGDKADFLVDLDRANDGVLIRQAMIEYLKSNISEHTAKVEGRITK